ncbi:MAG: aminopeptidase [Candidatus Woesearchaeota archaeon]
MVVSKEILDKYADLLIKFALNDFKGIKKDDVVLLRVPECAKPMLKSLYKKVLEAGGHPIVHFSPDDMKRDIFENGSEEQITFYPKKYMDGIIDQIDHLVSIIAETNKKELEGIDSKKIMARGEALKEFREKIQEKENKGKLTWTLALYGTKQMANEVNMSLEEYWGEIINACYLDEEDPVLKWREVVDEIERVRKELNSLDIDYLRIESLDTDLIIGLDENRKWLGGSGRNIPSFELYISPDCKRTSGKIRFNKDLYRYGNLIQDVYLEFENGRVTKADASTGLKVLKDMIATKGADMVGEFSLTDRRLSRITKFMGETLFDENVGGEQGNTHIALGSAYKDSYTKDPSKVSKEQWEELGFNESSVHTDIVSTNKRKVTATLKDGSKKVIYENGEFKV